MATSVHSIQDSASGDPACSHRYMLWIDGVGAYLIFTADRVTIGGPARPGTGSDLVLMANLSRQQATILRTGDDYMLEATGPCQVANRPVAGRTHLGAKTCLELGSDVRLEFRIPSPLSATALINFLSDHRPSRSLDGVLLMKETCLLGPGPGNHVDCAGWTDSVLLYRNSGRFWCKSPSPFLVDGHAEPSTGPVELRVDPGGADIRGSDFGFRLEPDR